MADFLDLAFLHVASRATAGAQRAASEAQNSARDAAQRVRDLETQMDRVTLYLAAALELLVARGGVKAEDLRAKVREIDLRDGTLDGRVAPTPAWTCLACERVCGARHARCIYCGAPRAEHPAHRPLA